MRSFGSAVLALLATAWVAAGCGASEAPAVDASVGIRDASTSPAEAGRTAADATPEPEPDPEPPRPPRPDAGPPMSCVDIRNCIVRCEADAACAQRCVDQAPQMARAAHQTVVTCSRQGCAADDINCRCERECQGGGECIDIVDACKAFSLDIFCDELCM